MKSLLPAACALLLAGLATLPSACAAEDADGPDVAYPVGISPPPVSTVASTPPVAAPAPPPSEAPPGYEAAAMSPPPAAAPEPEPVDPAVSQDVVVGGDSDPEGAGPAPEAESDAVSTAAPPPPPADPAVADADPSALTDFRTALDPYGSWVDDPTYGTVWVPSPGVVGPDFTPYVTAGHWAYDDDYVWVSDYSWGWAPFHYGRWAYVAGPGWEWIPGRAYAGAWVSWRYGWGDWPYVGWAPLAPTWCWRRGVAVGLGFVPRAPYGFVATADLFAPRLGPRLVSGSRVGLVAAHTRPWVPAAPAVGARFVARPAVGGPPPSALRIPQSTLVRVGANEGVLRARAFGGGRVAAAASFRGGLAYPRVAAPAYGPPVSPRFGARLGGGGFARGAPARAAAPVGPRPYFGPAPVYSAPRVVPAYRAGAAPASAPAVRGSMGRGWSGSGSAPRSVGGYSGGFHGGGGFHTGGGFRGGGGWHGGGRGGRR